MNLGIHSKTAYIAAASQGIGLATATLLAKEGANVAICARTPEKLQSARTQIHSNAPKANIHTTTCDVSNLESIENWFQDASNTVGKPDILITNTGGPPAGHYPNMTDEDWQSGVDSTLMNVVRMVRLATPHMQSQNWGRIVHITSLVAKEPHSILPISSTLRAGLLALTRLQATELASHQVTVNSVLPGHTLTERQTHLAEVIAQQENITVDQALHNRAQTVPLKRLATPDEIANAVAFLASKPAAYITGTNLLVDGGLTQGLG